MSVSSAFYRCLAAQAAVATLLLGCATTTTFNQTTYENAISLKAETLSLIDKSSNRFAASRPQVETLATKFDAAYEAAAKDKSDQAVAQAWDNIRGPRSGSAGEYLLTWKQRGTIRPKTRAEKKVQIARHFDYVICLEGAKRSAATCTNPFGAAPAAAVAAPSAVEPVEVEVEPVEPPPQ